MKSRSSIALLFSVVFQPIALHAEPSAVDKSLATQLFKEGRALVDQGKIPEGCRKLEESQRLDPGGGTLLNLALCHEKEGRSATAWAEFTEALGLAKKDDRSQRVELAQAHIAALEPTLSRLVIQVGPESADLADLEIKRDGSVIRRAAWGSAMPVDPGDHVVEATAQGKVAWKQIVSVGPKGDTKALVVPALDNAPAATPRVAAAMAAPTSSPAETPSASRAPAAWVAMGFGAVGLGVGAYFGVHAMSLQKDADKTCSADQCSTPGGAGANADAIKAANIATVGFGVGILGAALGTYLFLTSGPTSRSRPTTSATRLNIAPSRGGALVAVDGQF